MSFWDDLEDAASSVGSAIKDGAEAVAGAVGDAVNAVGEAVSDAVETVGHGASKVIKRLGRAARKIPVIGPALERAVNWVGDVVSSVTHFAATVIKGAFGAVAGVVSGIIRVVGGGIGGALAGDGKVFVKGLGNIGAGIGGAVLIIGGGALGLVQTIILLQGERVPLTREEHELLWRVFRRSVAFENVRVVRGWAGLLSLSSKPVTIGNTIYLKTLPANENFKHLVHECGHVWQYQNLGAGYTAEALGAKWTLDNAYDWTAELARGKHHWRDFNTEAQAELLEDVYLDGRRTDVNPSGPGDFYDDDPIGVHVKFAAGETDFTNLARESIAYVRSAFTWHLDG
jgi:hypothetical protein